MRLITLCMAAAIAAAAMAATAASAQDAGPVPEAYSKLLECRALADDAERLACFDVAVGRLETAEESDEIVIVSREQVEETRRGLFGLKLPKIRLFGGDGEKDEIKELVSTIASFSGGTGSWVFTLEDGAVWVQTDGGFVRKPEVGQEITIRRGALGSYFASVDGGVTFRISRRN